MLDKYQEILTLSNGLGLLGIIVAFLIGKWYAKKHKISCYVDTREFFDLNKDLKKTDLQITYEGIPLKSLAQSYIYIWNSGNEIIDKSDLSTINPLQICLEDSDQVFEYKVKKVTRDVISPSLKDNKKINFEYLDPKDGFVIEVLHSSHDTKKLTVEGVVKKINHLKMNKVKKTKEDASEKQKKLKKIVTKITPIIAYIPLFFGLIILYTGLFVDPQDLSELKSKSKNNTSMITIGILYSLFTPFILYSTRRKYPKYLELDDN